MLLVFSTAHFVRAENTKHYDEVMQVVENFRLALVEKDEQKFVDLFYHKSVPWIGITGLKRTGNLPTNNGEQLGNHLSFIGWVVSTPQQIEEKFWDIKIHTDGDVASVYFKYSFHKDNYKSNWGDESWHLINTMQGWKISSVIYSITDNPEPKKETQYAGCLSTHNSEAAKV